MVGSPPKVEPEMYGFPPASTAMALTDELPLGKYVDQATDPSGFSLKTKLEERDAGKAAAYTPAVTGKSAELVWPAT